MDTLVCVQSSLFRRRCNGRLLGTQIRSSSFSLTIFWCFVGIDLACVACEGVQTEREKFRRGLAFVQFAA